MSRIGRYQQDTWVGREVAADRYGPQLRETPPARLYPRHLKRGFDLTLAVVLLTVVAPVIAVLWLLTVASGGSGFFGHRRVGRDGKIFRCWKIQTMVPDADAVLARHLAENPEDAAIWERDFKLPNDPRITRLGAILRKTSLDELPQIWNVLRGEMSFVGPRPVTQVELMRYGPHMQAYLDVRPGITGLWQVSGRNSVSYEERVRLDRAYVDTLSFLGDLRILALTAGAVIFGTGR